MNTGKGTVKFKNFRTPMDSGCGSKIAMVRFIKITPKKEDVMQWHTQAGKITTNLKVNIDFTLPEISVTTIVS